MNSLATKSEYQNLKSDSFYKNFSSLILPAKNLTISHSEISFNKPPFLPKLPKKALLYRQNDTHLINDFYLEPELSKSCNSLGRKVLIDFKGDLLKAKQIYLALNSNMSGTMKHVKTSDTPWNRDVSKNSKPLKSSLIKNKIEPENYIKTSRCRTNVSFRYSAGNSSTNSKNSIQIKSSSNLNKLLANLDYEPVMMKQFAEDLLNEHYARSSFKNQDDSKPDIALHVFNSIWEVHRYALLNSPYLSQLLEIQTNLLPTSETRAKIKESKEKTRTNINREYLDKLTNILLEIKSSMIDKNSLAVAIGNLYHPETIEVPARLASGILAAAHLLKFDKLKAATIAKMSESLTKATIGSYYHSCNKYNEKIGIEICEKWLEMHLIPCVGSSIHLREIPLKLLTKIVKSSRFFTLNEYETFLTIITWIFLNINRDIKEVPTESVMITYFSSFGKDKNLIERYPDLGDLLYSIRLYGITKTNYLNTIQQMNIYPNTYIVQIMMEIQYSISHGGDMAINRLFETSALRQGIVVDVNDENYSDVFSMYGFHFELIAEKIKSDDVSHTYQFYIQRLSTNDPILTYEQSQLETFSLRNDRFCNYSISVQYWHQGNQVIESTGKKKQRFGKLKTLQTPVFTVILPKYQSSDEKSSPNELLVLYSLTFPTN
ncbi:BTB POZ domain-containing 16 [Brachionus plicatilis]|uniref:BTB/POZ domain-containing protein 16 n=1 Tax=Brachionus plicatilis TaxID=10195 RepID=A0A3M7RI88_BRAPC|nr:BTB POZ domain-containing 16 [Brachionus plicatilis]